MSISNLQEKLYRIAQKEGVRTIKIEIGSSGSMVWVLGKGHCKYCYLGNESYAKPTLKEAIQDCLDQINKANGL